MTEVVLQAAASGLVTGCIYALVALSLVLVYKSTEVVNFGGGEVAMFGAYAGMLALVYFELPYAAALGFVIAVSFLLGGLFDRLILRPITQQESSGQSTLVPMIIATIGLSYILKGAVRVVPYTEEVRRLPPLFTGAPVFIGPVVLQRHDIALILISLGIMTGLWYFFQHTFTGKAVRAMSQNHRAAALIGIPLGKMRVAVWDMAAVLAGIAGVLLAPKLLMTPDMGSVVILGLAAAIIGGFTSLPGCVVGGIFLGVLQNLLAVLVSPQAITVTPFVVIMLVLVFRPQGLFGGAVSVKKV